jgi:HPr kinase/phosphorylase
MVFGEPADLLRHHLEVRGLGILNVKDLFGVTAVRERKRIDVVVQLVEASDNDPGDRLGLEERVHSILDVDIPALLIGVRPGRDMASIMEIAARSELLKHAGHHPTSDFFSRFDVSSDSEIPPTTSSGSNTPSSMIPSAGLRRRGPLGVNVTPPPESAVSLPIKYKK